MALSKFVRQIISRPGGAASTGCCADDDGYPGGSVPLLISVELLQMGGSLPEVPGYCRSICDVYIGYLVGTRLLDLILLQMHRLSKSKFTCKAIFAGADQQWQCSLRGVKRCEEVCRGVQRCVEVRRGVGQLQLKRNAAEAITGNRWIHPAMCGTEVSSVKSAHQVNFSR